MGPRSRRCPATPRQQPHKQDGPGGAGQGRASRPRMRGAWQNLTGLRRSQCDAGNLGSLNTNGPEPSGSGQFRGRMILARVQAAVPDTQGWEGVRSPSVKPLSLVPGAMSMICLESCCMPPATRAHSPFQVQTNLWNMELYQLPLIHPSLGPH